MNPISAFAPCFFFFCHSCLTYPFATGKWHNGPGSILKSFEHGKAVYMGGMSDHTEVPIQDISNGELTNKRMGKKFSSTLFDDRIYCSY